MILTAFVLDGETLGTQKSDWGVTDLYVGGVAVTPFKIEESASSGFTDITSIENIYKYGHSAERDFPCVRNCMLECFGTTVWSACTNSEKDKIIEFVAYTGDTNDVDKLDYLQGVKGLTSGDSITFLLDSREVADSKFVSSFSTRFEHCKRTVLKYLQTSDITDLYATDCVCSGRRFCMFDYYNHVGRCGQDFGCTTSGFTEFIVSTGCYSASGLSSKAYTTKTGTLDDFISELTDIVIKGIYS